MYCIILHFILYCTVSCRVKLNCCWRCVGADVYKDSCNENLGIEYSRRCLEWLAAWNRHHDMDTNQPDIEKEQRKKRKVFGLMISATGGSKRFHVQTTRSKDNMSHLSDRSLPPSLLQLQTTERLLSLRATSLTSRCRFCDPADVLFEG